MFSFDVVTFVVNSIEIGAEISDDSSFDPFKTISETVSSFRFSCNWVVLFFVRLVAFFAMDFDRIEVFGDWKECKLKIKLFPNNETIGG